MGRSWFGAAAGLSLALGSAITASLAVADGMPQQNKGFSAPVVHGAYNWSGIYAGGHLGGAWSDSKYTVSNSGLSLREAFDPASFAGGVQMIYQGQARNFVVGVEMALTGVGLEERKTSSTFANRVFQSDVDWLFTLTPRIGFASGSWLVYLKGGLSAADISRATYTGTTGFQRNGQTHIETGWVIGTGFEVAMSPVVSLGLDYSYIWFETPNRNNGLSQFDPVGGGTTFINHDVDIHSLTARLNLKLGG